MMPQIVRRFLSRPSIKISRPRFWLYLLGPYAIGVAAASTQQLININAWLILVGLFFCYPANYIIYGVNDVYDYDTDKVNPKKKGYETLVGPQFQSKVLRQALAWMAVGYILLELIPGNNDAAQWGLFGFLFFGLLYSMPPVRAKTKPLLDSIFNVLYVFPAVVGYGLASGAANLYPSASIFLAATVWCMAMHAYSAIPDITADSQAGIKTIATWLGARGTLLFCLACYSAAGILSWPALGWFSLAGAVVYAAIMLISLLNPGRQRLFRLYTFFPHVNMLVGMALFFWIVLVIR